MAILQLAMIVRCMLLIMVTTVVGWSSPTIVGPTGLIRMPTADSVAYKQVVVGAYYLSAPVFQKGSVVSTENQGHYIVNLGSFKDWELGILGGSFLEEGVLVNAKYFLMSNNEEYPLSIAAGVQSIGSATDLSMYLVTSKRFSGGLHAHFGFNAFVQNKLNAVAMLGASYFLEENMAFMVDVIGADSDRYMLNVGGEIVINNHFAIHVYGLDLVNPSDKSDTVYSIGISMNRYI